MGVTKGARKPNDNLNILSSNIRKYGVQRGLSQSDICREIALICVKMYTADIYDIEYNKITIKDYEVFAFSKVLKVLLAELYKGTEKEFNLSLFI